MPGPNGRGRALSERQTLHDEAREFNPLLPSQWVALPYPGDTGKIRVQFNLEKVMELGEVYSALMRDDLDRLSAAERERVVLTTAWQDATEAFSARQIAVGTQREERLAAVGEVLARSLPPDEQWKAVRLLVLDDADFGADWPTRAEDEAAAAAATTTYTEAIERLTAEIEDIQESMARKVVQYTVSAFDWPFRGAPPDPRDAATWARAGLSGHVIHWIAQEGTKEARTQVNGPLFVGRSRAIS
jgi:hypothetical protein